MHVKSEEETQISNRQAAGKWERPKAALPLAPVLIITCLGLVWLKPQSLRQISTSQLSRSWPNKEAT